MTIAPEAVGSPTGLRRSSQLEAMDVRVENIQLGDLEQVVNLTENIIDGEIERTIAGASTLKFTVSDPQRKLLRSGLLTNESSVVIDGLMFRLVGIEVSEDRKVILSFEDESVAALRTEDRYIKEDRAQTTRAQFAMRLVRSGTLPLSIEFISPELQVEQPVEQPERQVERERRRAFGISMEDQEDITVKGQVPTRVQINNINRVLSTGVQLKANRKVLVASIMTIIQESNAMNLELGKGHLDSVGLFQQRISLRPRWPASRDIREDAAAFFRTAKRIDATNPRLALWALCNAVQRPAYEFRTLYDKWREESKKIVNVFGYASSEDETVIREDSYIFSRGTPDEKENSWECLQRLAEEVNWRCFSVSGTIYFISDEHLFRSSTRATIHDGTPGVLGIEANYDSGQEVGEINVRCQLSRWGAPPGSVVKVTRLGPLNGKWLVHSIYRSLFERDGDVVLRKPLPKLPEPAARQIEIEREISLEFGLEIEGGTIREKIVAVAEEMLSRKRFYTYRQFRPYPSDIFSEDAYNKLDCSSFFILVYKSAGAIDPNGTGYDGTGWTVSLAKRGRWTNNPRLGDAVFYGRLRSRPEHVDVYIGDSKTIGFGSTPIRKKNVDYRSDFLGYMTFRVSAADIGTVNEPDEVSEHVSTPLPSTGSLTPLGFMAEQWKRRRFERGGAYGPSS